MAKKLEEYTDAELIKIGKTTVAARIKAAESDREKRDILSKLYEQYKAGKIKV